jgi:hypothetical protein
MKVNVTIYDHEYARSQAKAMPDPKDMPIEEVVNRIVTLTEGLRKFWDSADGWAPIEAAQLLSKSRLDWQVSLAACLRIWTEKTTAPVFQKENLGWRHG